MNTTEYRPYNWPTPLENGERGGIVNNRDVYWFYRQVEDGTYQCQAWWMRPDRVCSISNPEYFATESDATVYCESRTHGSLHIGGMMRVIDMQVANARMAYEFIKG